MNCSRHGGNTGDSVPGGDRLAGSLPELWQILPRMPIVIRYPSQEAPGDKLLNPSRLFSPTARC